MIFAIIEQPECRFSFLPPSTDWLILKAVTQSLFGGLQPDGSVSYTLDGLPELFLCLKNALSDTSYIQICDEHRESSPSADKNSLQVSNSASASQSEGQTSKRRNNKRGTLDVLLCLITSSSSCAHSGLRLTNINLFMREKTRQLTGLIHSSGLSFTHSCSGKKSTCEAQSVFCV